VGKDSQALIHAKSGSIIGRPRASNAIAAVDGLIGCRARESWDARKERAVRPGTEEANVESEVLAHRYGAICRSHTGFNIQDDIGKKGGSLRGLKKAQREMWKPPIDNSYTIPVSRKSWSRTILYQAKPHMNMNHITIKWLIVWRN
jgi:hypothetical protein